MGKPSTFPKEDEPDGERLGPHHHYIGLLVCLLVGTTTDALLLTGGALTGIFGFATMWTTFDGREPNYPQLGALVSIIGICVSFIGSLLVMVLGGVILGTLGIFGALIATDDTVEHAFGVSTPIDTLWNRVYSDYLSKRN